MIENETSLTYFFKAFSAFLLKSFLSVVREAAGKMGNLQFQIKIKADDGPRFKQVKTRVGIRGSYMKACVLTSSLDSPSLLMLTKLFPISQK